MSLNKFTSTATGSSLGLNIGCNDLKVDGVLTVAGSGSFNGVDLKAEATRKLYVGDDLSASQLDNDSVYIGAEVATLMSGVNQRNTALGSSAFSLVNGAGDSTALGYLAMGGTVNSKTGDFNTAVGSRALHDAKSGESNVAVGHQAGQSLDTGGFNTAIGKAALTNPINGTHNTSLGYLADLGDTASTNPIHCTLIGQGAGRQLNAAVTYSDQVVVATRDTLAGHLILGQGNITKHWSPFTDGDTNLGITGTNRWDNIYAINATITTSDARVKENVKDSELGFDFINKLRPVSYKLKDVLDRSGTITEVVKDSVIDEKTGEEIEIEYEKEVTDPDNQLPDIIHKRRHFGLIAQEVEAVLAECKVSNNDCGALVIDDKGNYSLRYEEFVCPLIKAVQELSMRVKALES